jgi:hypothetical protein
VYKTYSFRYVDVTMHYTTYNVTKQFFDYNTYNLTNALTALSCGANRSLGGHSIMRPLTYVPVRFVTICYVPVCDVPVYHVLVCYVSVRSILCSLCPLRISP